MKRAAKSFEPTENVKEVLVELDNSANKMVRIGTTPPTSRKARSSTSSTLIDTSLRGNPQICRQF